ncbi:cytosolic protein [Mesobacillus harenae]|uniref:cytosolic protein n=1 Tax=Mesobacillus harenae TaxID=2213203 RepID=UPI001580CD44|nr:cytosolic protein [Mesobacillus harenae]
MKKFTVSFHEQDQLDEITVHKLNEQDYEKASEGGTRHLFELDTNIGFFVFFDCVDKEGNASHLVFQLEEDSEEATACYGFELKEFYEFMALYLNDFEFNEETNEDEEVYGPIQHLAHLMYHIVEEGKTISE